MKGNSEQQGLLARSLEGMRLKFRDKEGWGRGRGLMGVNTSEKIPVSYVNIH